MLDLAWAAASHAGHVRARNEDAVLADPPVFVIADGMGGHEAGDVAAATVVDVLGRLARRPDLSRPAVLDAVRAANGELAALGGRTGRTMGTTVCGLVTLANVAGPRLILFNVGDSRAYRLRAGQLEQLTHDHSVVQELMDAGALSAAQAREHPGRHIVTRSLGSDEPLAIDWWTVSPEAGDRYLLTSDGLSGELDDDDIRSILDGAGDVRTASDQLIDEALRRGGRDNVSVIVVDVAGAGEDAYPCDSVTDPLDADTRPRRRGGLEPDTTPWTGQPLALRDRALFADTDPLNEP